MGERFALSAALIELTDDVQSLQMDGVGVVDTLAPLVAMSVDGDAATNALDQAITSYVDWEKTDEDRAKSAFAQVFKFLAEAEKYPNGVSDRDWKPQHTGLHLTSPPVDVKSGRSSSLWVSRPEGIALFEKKGWDALKSKLLRAQLMDGNGDDN